MKALHLLPFLLSTALSISQEVVFLTNPSFEGNPQYAAVPGGWRNCAFNNESPPDIHPVANSTLNLEVNPLHGETFLGLLSKGNATTESIGQQLERPLKKGLCYSMSLYLCKSPNYAIFNERTERYVHYEGTLVLRLWGGTSPCGKKSLLAVSPPVKNTGWVKYSFQFSPNEDINHVTLEAYYSEGTNTAYRGNLLLDNASPFIPIDCAMKLPLVDETALVIPPYQFKKIPVPLLLKKSTAWAVEGNGSYPFDVRMAVKESDLEWIVFDNCNRIGFRLSNRRLLDGRGIGLKEIAVNLKHFKTKKLVIGIQHLGDRLDKRRAKTIKRTFREIGLPPKYYRIETVSGNDLHTEWLCGQKEIWLKLEGI